MLSTRLLISASQKYITPLVSKVAPLANAARDRVRRSVGLSQTILRPLSVVSTRSDSACVRETLQITWREDFGPILGSTKVILHDSNLRQFSDILFMAPTELGWISATLQCRSARLLINNRRFTSVSLVGRRQYTTQTEAQSQTELNAQVSSHDRQIANWLSIVTGMVFGIVSVGGITRLTESGLSITEWKPITGSVPPMNEDDWKSEFEKYKQFPEFKKLNSNMTLSEFKSIYLWEWSHRFLGRLIGVVFALPLGYFAAKGRFTKGQLMHYTGLLALGGAQGALGWYMVKSGLEVQEGEYPRVSAYRLCAHLGLAFTLYLGTFWGAMTLYRPSMVVKQAIPPRLKAAAGVLTGLIFTTAMSGAFVAGLDAGLCYNEFPYMGDGFVPEEYWRREPAWKNFTENSPAVQFNHRVLALTTWASANALWFFTRKTPLPRPTKLAINSIAIVAWIQAGLGISTLLYFVPIPLAAAHQIGSLTLLSCSTWLLHTVVRRKPIKMP